MIALVAFAIAALTDALDGYAARTLGQSSAFGRQLDPLVDKIMVIVILAQLSSAIASKLLPWVVTIIVTRELVVQALRSQVEGRGIPFGARWSGKLKTMSQFLAIAAVLLSLALPKLPGATPLRDLSLWTALVLTAYSGWVYLVIAWKVLKKSPVA